MRSGLPSSRPLPSFLPVSFILFSLLFSLLSRTQRSKMARFQKLLRAQFFDSASLQLSCFFCLPPFPDSGPRECFVGRIFASHTLTKASRQRISGDILPVCLGMEIRLFGALQNSNAARLGSLLASSQRRLHLGPWIRERAKTSEPNCVQIRETQINAAKIPPLMRISLIYKDNQLLNMLSCLLFSSSYSFSPYSLSVLCFLSYK